MVFHYIQKYQSWGQANIDFENVSKKFCGFCYFAGFDIKIVLLVQNSFDWIAFCWVESIFEFIFKPVLKN